MKPIYLLLLLLSSQICTAQSNTEIYLFDLRKDGKTLTLLNGKNISNSNDYDSQPYFLGKNALIYAGSRNGNTEIIQYARGKERIFNASTPGGEYSPQPIPEQRGISAVRLDPDGYQRLYRYTSRSSQSVELVKNSVVAYYTWFDASTIVCAAIVDKDLHLVIHDITVGTSTDLEVSVGRSFAKIPNTGLIGFIDKTEEIWTVSSIDPKTLKIKKIAPLITGSQDIAWLKDGSIIASKDNTLYIKKKKKDWAVLHTFPEDYMQKLSRIAISPNGSQIAVVSETTD